MRILIIVDKFSSKKGLKERMEYDPNSPKPWVEQLYEFLGGKDFEIVDRIMRNIPVESPKI